MILEGIEVPEAMILLEGATDESIVVHVDGERYGGFRSEEHAKIFIRQMKRSNPEAVILRGTSSLPPGSPASASPA